MNEKIGPTGRLLRVGSAMAGIVAITLAQIGANGEAWLIALGIVALAGLGGFEIAKALHQIAQDWL